MKPPSSQSRILKGTGKKKNKKKPPQKNTLHGSEGRGPSAYGPVKEKQAVRLPIGGADTCIQGARVRVKACHKGATQLALHLELAGVPLLTRRRAVDSVRIARHHHGKANMKGDEQPERPRFQIGRDRPPRPKPTEPQQDVPKAQCERDPHESDERFFCLLVFLFFTQPWRLPPSP